MKVKIGIMDLTAFDHPRVSNPMKLTVINDDHAHDVFKEIEHQAEKFDLDLDNFEFVLLRHTMSGFAKAKELGVHIITMSLSDSWGLSGEQSVKDSILMITSAGNQGDKGETSAARREEWLAVGSVDKDLKPRSYSSHGLKKVVTVGIDGNSGRYGTSFASPYVALLCGEMYRQHYLALGYFPTNPKVAVHWVKFHSHDIFEEGFDENTGYGLLKLPKRWEFEEWVYSYDQPNCIRRKVIDGIAEEKEVDMYMVPRNVSTRLYNQFQPMFSALGIPKGRSIFTIRDIAKNSNVYYDGKVRISRVV